MRYWTILTMVVIFSCALRAQENWNGFRDTSTIRGFKGDTLVYSKTFELSKHEHSTIIVLCNDTTSAGYANDSVAFLYGYQLGVPVLSRGAGARDTAWSPMVVVDSITALGQTSAWQQDSLLATRKRRGWADTSNVDGWAYTYSQIVPEGGAPLIRVFLRGLAKNKKAVSVAAVVQISRRLGNSNITR